MFHNSHWAEDNSNLLTVRKHQVSSSSTDFFIKHLLKVPTVQHEIHRSNVVYIWACLYESDWFVPPQLCKIIWQMVYWVWVVRVSFASRLVNSRWLEGSSDFLPPLFVLLVTISRFPDPSFSTRLLYDCLFTTHEGSSEFHVPLRNPS